MWISVHDSVDGSKLRKLARLTGCSKGEALGVLTAVWLWGAKNADESGLIRDSTEDDIALVALPFLSKGTDSTEFVENMIEAGWIERVDGELYFHDWEDWQAQWYRYQREKARDTKRRREARQAKRGPDGEAPPGPVGKATEVRPPTSPAGEEPEPEQKKPEKPKKPTKPKPEKKNYGEFVTMTEAEYGELVKRYGEAATQKMIEELDNYKGSTGKTYKSDYRTILNWVWERVKEKYPGLIKPQAKTQTQPGGLDDLVPGDWSRGRG